MVELKQSDLIETKAKVEETVNDIDTIKSIPNNYVEIKLSSKGKLSAPKILHVRNFTMREAIEISSVTKKENELIVLLNCINNMIYEDFDAYDLHEKELEELLLNIHVNFWSTKMTEMPYYLELEKENIDSEDNIAYTDIDLISLKTNNLKSEFKEPINIEKNNLKVQFRYPRLKDNIFAFKYIEKLYEEEREKWLKLEYGINHLKPKDKDRIHEIFDLKELDAYTDYIDRRQKDYLTAFNSRQIVSINGKILKDEEKLDMIDKIPMDYWAKFMDIKENYTFGVDNEVKFHSEILKKNIVRRFQFQLMDYVYSLDLQDDSTNSISFGD